MNENDFEWVYNLADMESVVHGDGFAGIVPELTQILEKCNIDVLNKVSSLPNYYCLGRKDVESVVIPSNITIIGTGAFAHCTNLTSIQISDTCKEIRSGAFEYCEKLTHVDIPDSVEEIEDSAFYSCDNLTSVSFGKSLYKIGASAFEFCPNLKQISYNGTVLDWKTQVNKGPHWIACRTRVVKCLDGNASIKD